MFTNMVYVIIYFVWLFLVVLLYVLRNSFSLAHYFVFNRSGGVFEVSMSLVALVFGASSVFGLAGWGYKFGWNALWWIIPGVVGLLVLSIFFSRAIYQVKGVTISDIVEKVFGIEVKVLVSVILFIAWLSVLAGQIIAGGNIASYLFGGNKVVGYVVFTVLFAGYTVLYGQVGTMKTGFLQVILMVAAIVVLLFAVFGRVDLGGVKELRNITFSFDDKFTFDFWFSLFVAVFLSYLFGPDIYSRIFSSNSERTARFSLIISSILILIIATLIVLLGIVSRYYLGNIANPDKVILEISLDLLPEWLKPLMMVFLISIPLSGADIILVTVTALLVRDFLFNIVKNEKVREKLLSLVFVRIFSMVAITITLVIALYGKDIISTLMVAYKIFSNSITPFILASLVLINKKKSIHFSSVSKLILVSSLAVVGTYSILAEIFIPQIKFRFYELVLIFLLLLVISLVVWVERKNTFFNKLS
jgi:SSS family solute:Na+ symporter